MIVTENKIDARRKTCYMINVFLGNKCKSRQGSYGVTHFLRRVKQFKLTFHTNFNMLYIKTIARYDLCAQERRVV